MTVRVCEDCPGCLPDLAGSTPRWTMYYIRGMARNGVAQRITHAKGCQRMTTPSMHAIRDYYVASTAMVAGNVTLSPGVNVWFGCVVRGDLSTITLGPRVNLQDGCIVHTDSDASMIVGEG